MVIRNLELHARNDDDDERVKALSMSMCTAEITKEINQSWHTDDFK